MTDNLAKIREALEPFALMAEAIGEARPSIRTDEDIVYGFEKTRLSLGDFKRARAAYDSLSAPAPEPKEVPMAMLKELFEYVADEPEQWGRAEQEDFAMIVSKHMPGYTAKE